MFPKFLATDSRIYSLRDSTYGWVWHSNVIAFRRFSHKSVASRVNAIWIAVIQYRKCAYQRDFSHRIEYRRRHWNELKQLRVVHRSVWRRAESECRQHSQLGRPLLDAIVFQGRWHDHGYEIYRCLHCFMLVVRYISSLHSKTPSRIATRYFAIGEIYPPETINCYSFHVLGDVLLND